MDSPSPTYHPPLKKNQSPKKGGGDSLLVKDWLGCQENIGFFFFCLVLEFSKGLAGSERGCYQFVEWLPGCRKQCPGLWGWGQGTLSFHSVCHTAVMFPQ